MNKISLFVVLSIVAETSTLVGGTMIAPVFSASYENMTMGMAMDNMTIGIDNSSGMSSSNTPPM